MSNPAIHGNRAVYSAFSALAAIGKALGEIKAQDGLTWGDIGAVLGVSDDQAAKYGEGTASMNAVTFGRGKREWNGRFTGYFDRLCVDSRPGTIGDHSALTTLVEAAARLSKALEDGEITDVEVLGSRSQLENARDALNEQLAKLDAFV